MHGPNSTADFSYHAEIKLTHMPYLLLFNSSRKCETQLWHSHPTHDRRLKTNALPCPENSQSNKFI